MTLTRSVAAPDVFSALAGQHDTDKSSRPSFASPSSTSPAWLRVTTTPRSRSTSATASSSWTTTRTPSTSSSPTLLTLRARLRACSRSLTSSCSMMPSGMAASSLRKVVRFLYPSALERCSRRRTACLVLRKASCLEPRMRFILLMNETMLQPPLSPVFPPSLQAASFSASYFFLFSSRTYPCPED